jgi:hypothetical protein
MANEDILKVAAQTPRLLFKLFFTYLRFKRKVKKATKAFKKELIRSGLERDTAIMLAEEFSKSAEILSVSNLSSMITR